MNLISIIVFCLLVLIPAISEYRKDKGSNYLAKTINLIVVFLLFQIYTGEAKERIVWIINNSYSIESDVFIKVGILSPFINGLLWFLYILISLIIIGFVVLLALRKEKYRIRFLYLLPFLWIIESSNLYRYAVLSGEFEMTNYLLPLILVITGIMVLILIILYSSNFMKRFFQVRTD